MSSVSETIVREYFEALGFLVHQPRKYTVMARSRRPGEEIDFAAVRPGCEPAPAPPAAADMVATGQVLASIPRLIASVRGWHTDRFSPATLNLSPEVFRFADDVVLKEAARLVGPGSVAKVLCLPALPTDEDSKAKALGMLRQRGVDYVVLFPTMLRELARQVDVNCNYEKSDLLQTLRILKNYDLLKDEQLELFRRRRPRRAAVTPPGDA